MAGCQKCKVCIRMLIYMGTIVTHLANIVVMHNSFWGEPMENEEVRHFSKMQPYFFTCWTFTFQIFYAAVGLFCDWNVIRNRDEKKSPLPDVVVKFREYLFSVAVWPSTLIVASYFWGFYLYDRSLVYPEHIDTVITPVSNHIMHTLIVPIALIELVFYPRTKPDRHILMLLFIYGIEAAYVCALFMGYKAHGVWVYPFLALMNGSLCFPAFIIATAVYLTVLYYFQFCVSLLVFNVRERIARKYCKGCMN